MSKCLITGCKIIDTLRGKYAHGDLHQEGECYVFRACLNTDQKVNWHHGDLPHPDKALLVDGSHNYFEADGVIVVATECATLNEAASEYIAGY